MDESDTQGIGNNAHKNKKESHYKAYQKYLSTCMII